MHVHDLTSVKLVYMMINLLYMEVFEDGGGVYFQIQSLFLDH